MLDLKFVTGQTPEVEKSLRKRHADKLVPILQQIVALDVERRKAIQMVETLKAKRNAASQEIAKAKKSGGDTTAIMAEMKQVADSIKELDTTVVQIQDTIQTSLLEIPNVLHESVPEGQDAAQNKVVRSWGAPKEFGFPAKSHYDIGEALGLLDFKKAGEVTGARFCFVKGLAARMERALIQFMLDTHRESGYEEMVPPFLVNRASLTGTGQLPKFAEDVFHVEKFDFFLIPTAEVPVTNYHRDEILDDKRLPISYCAYTPCFRSEAGSYGKDTKGLKRQHQFNKVELVKFVRPEDSIAEHEKLTAHAERILQLLELPYRVVALCGGDTGFNSGKTYDIEVWSPFEKGFMEISSCSNFFDYQARRAGIRYRDGAGKVQFVHTLNGSGLAVGRTLIAIMENYQKADGTFSIPKALEPYLS